MKKCRRALKKNNYLKNRLSHSVFEEEYIRKPLILVKAGPKQFFSSQSQPHTFQLCQSSFGNQDCLVTHHWKSCPHYLSSGRILILYVVVLVMVLLDCLFESALLRSLCNPRYQCCFFPDVHKTIDLGKIQPLWFSPQPSLYFSARFTFIYDFLFF